MADVIAMVTEVSKMTTALSTEITQKDLERNAPDIKAAAIAKQIRMLVDELTEHVAKGDLDAIRKDDAE